MGYPDGAERRDHNALNAPRAYGLIPFGNNQKELRERLEEHGDGHDDARWWRSMDRQERRVAYRLGQLLARLERSGVLRDPGRTYQLASVQPSQMSRLAAEATRRGKADLIGPVLERLPADAFSRTLTVVERGAFSLGYHHEKAG